MARRVLVSGRVQGVAFRWATRERARELRVDGWVRNLRDGRVEVWAEGDPSAVSVLLEWLSRGPPGARVADLEARAATPSGETGFEVRRRTSGDPSRRE